MNTVIRVHIRTKVERYEELKKAHMDAGFQIANENPIPVNGLASFDALRDLPGANA